MALIFKQDIDAAIIVMRQASKNLSKKWKSISKWWDLENLNKNFLLQYHISQEFYVGYYNDIPAVAAILQKSSEDKLWSLIWKGKDSAFYIHYLCVNPEFSWTWLVKKIINFTSELAKKHNITQIRVDTNAQEKKLCSIYEKNGFQLVQIIEEDYRKTALYEINFS